MIVSILIGEGFYENNAGHSNIYDCNYDGNADANSTKTIFSAIKTTCFNLLLT